MLRKIPSLTGGQLQGEKRACTWARLPLVIFVRIGETGLLGKRVKAQGQRGRPLTWEEVGSAPRLAGEEAFEEPPARPDRG